MMRSEENMERIEQSLFLRTLVFCCAAFLGMIGFTFLIGTLMQYNVAVSRGHPDESKLQAVVLFQLFALVAFVVACIPFVFLRRKSLFSYLYLNIYAAIVSYKLRDEWGALLSSGSEVLSGDPLGYLYSLSLVTVPLIFLVSLNILYRRR